MTSAIVVGGGPNGLAAALTLADEGLDVTVLEASDRVGGGARSGEQTIPGVLHDECAGFHPLALDNAFTRRFDLTAHGVSWGWADVEYAHPLDGGRGAAAYRSVEQTADGLAESGPAWQRLFGPLSQRFDKITEDFLRPMVGIPSHPIALARFGVPSLLPASLLAKTFPTEEARALFGGVAVHNFLPPTGVLSSAIGLALGTAAHRYGWPVAVGGTETITRALVAQLEARGGRIETGVQVADYEQIADADVVMLDVAPAAAADILKDHQPAQAASAYRRFRHGNGAFQIAVAVRDGIPWQYEPARQAGTIHLGGTMNEMIAAEKSNVAGRVHDRPFVLLGQQYLADPSRSAGDIHPIDAYAHVPANYRGDATELILDQIERFAPGFRRRIVAIESRPTASIAADNANFLGGDIATGRKDPIQLIFGPRLRINPYRTGVDGVYLCSAATPPGPGVHGMCGWNAARGALNELQR